MKSFDQLEEVLENLNEGVLILSSKLKIKYANSTAQDLLLSYIDINYFNAVVTDHRYLKNKSLEFEIYPPGKQALKIKVKKIKWKKKSAHYFSIIELTNQHQEPDSSSLKEEGQSDKPSMYSNPLFTPDAELKPSEVVELISHELREPVRTISNYSQLMVMAATGKNKDLEDYKNEIRSAVDQLETFVSSFKSIAEITKENLSRTMLDAKQLIYDCLNEYHDALEEVKANVVVDQTGKVLIDKVYFKLLISNLIDNAIKFKKPHGGLNLHISCKSRPDEWLFAVRDNGKGINEVYHSKIFNLMFRLDERAEYKSQGLGLNMAKRIVQIHGGEIWVESVEDFGSTFYFTISK